MLRGKELGIGPMAAMEGLFIVKERLVMSANLMAAVIQNSGRFKFRVTKLINSGCEIEFFEREEGGSWEKVGVSSFTAEDAKLAGISTDTYKKFPRNMYYARAMSNGAKWFCPGIFASPVYLPDEIPDSPLKVDPETLEVTGVVASEAGGLPSGTPKEVSEEFTNLFTQLPLERQQALLTYLAVEKPEDMTQDDEEVGITKMKLYLNLPSGG